MCTLHDTFVCLPRVATNIYHLFLDPLTAAVPTPFTVTRLRDSVVFASPYAVTYAFNIILWR